MALVNVETMACREFFSNATSHTFRVVTFAPVAISTWQFRYSACNTRKKRRNYQNKPTPSEICVNLPSLAFLLPHSAKVFNFFSVKIASADEERNAQQFPLSFMLSFFSIGSEENMHLNYDFSLDGNANVFKCTQIYAPVVVLLQFADEIRSISLSLNAAARCFCFRGSLSSTPEWIGIK